MPRDRRAAPNAPFFPSDAKAQSSRAVIVLPFTTKRMGTARMTLVIPFSPAS